MKTVMGVGGLLSKSCLGSKPPKNYLANRRLHFGTFFSDVLKREMLG